MTPRVVWLVGEPGAGKTSVARHLLDSDARPLVNGRVKWTVGERVVAAGLYTGGAFDGADTVPYDGARPCLECWRDAGWARRKVTLFDGDRFSNANALAFVIGAVSPEALVCVHLTTKRAAERRAARSSVVQNAAWVRGRGTKAQRFYDTFPGARLQLDTDGQTPAELAAAIWAALGV